MLLCRWKDLPSFLQTDEVKPYYDFLKNKQFDLAIKRVFDIAVSLVMLVVLSPVLIALSIAIKLDSKGPVFYKQERVTQYGKRFKIHKFRTMCDGADKKGPSLTLDHDARITRVGKKIRKYRLDELGQLFDVLRGDMTFVGVRPEIPKYVAEYSLEMNATLLLPAGITNKTCIVYKDEDELLAVATDADKVYIEEILPSKMDINLRCMREFSFWDDIKVMFETFFAVIGLQKESEDVYAYTGRR